MFSILLYWLSSTGAAALICCCSAFCKRSLSAFVASTVIYAVPYFIRQFGIGGTVVGELMLLFPVCSAKAQQVVRTSEHKMIGLLPVTCEMPIWIAVFTAILIFVLFFLTYRHFCNGVQREHNKKLNNGLPILHKVPPKRDYGRYFCIMAEKGGTSHGGLTEKLSLFFHAKKQEVNAYGR